MRVNYLLIVMCYDVYINKRGTQVQKGIVWY